MAEFFICRKMRSINVEKLQKLIFKRENKILQFVIFRKIFCRIIKSKPIKMPTIKEVTPN